MQILQYTILNQKSATEDNFVITKTAQNRIQVRWKLLDPDEAVKIALLHSGEPISLSVVGKFSPSHSIGMTGTPIWTFLVHFMVFSAALSFYFATIGGPVGSYAYKLDGWKGGIVFTSSIVLGSVFAGACLLGSIHAVRIYLGDLPPINPQLEDSFLARINCNLVTPDNGYATEIITLICEMQTEQTRFSRAL